MRSDLAITLGKSVQWVQIDQWLTPLLRHQLDHIRLVLVLEVAQARAVTEGLGKAAVAVTDSVRQRKIGHALERKSAKPPNLCRMSNGLRSIYATIFSLG